MELPRIKKSLYQQAKYQCVLELKRPRRKITPLKAGFAIIAVIILWLVLQAAVQNALLNSVYLKFLLLCVLGFGFLVISFMLKYG
jgi:hypothetical protein